MNTAQEILSLLLKMGFTKEFQSSFTNKEFDLLVGINGALRDFKVEHAIEGSEGIAIIRWDSLIDKTVACTVSEGGFNFSAPQLYKSSTKRLKGLVKDNFTNDVMLEAVESEIQELQKLFQEYSLDAKLYFK